MDAAPIRAADTYQRNEPEESLLYQVLAKHLETFRQGAACDDHGLPAHVTRELRAWNPDTQREQQAMIALGVTGVSTNGPDILMQYLATDREA